MQTMPNLPSLCSIISLVRASSSLELAISALVDELTDGLEVGITPCDVRIGDTQHAQRRLVQLDESSVVDLTQTQQLKDLSDSGMESVDTPNPHHDGQLGLGRDVEVAVFPGIAGQTELISLGGLVLLGVSLGLLENGHALGFRRLLLQESSLDLLGTQFRARLSLLQERLGDSGNRFSRHSYIFYFLTKKMLILQTKILNKLKLLNYKLPPC